MKEKKRDPLSSKEIVHVSCRILRKKYEYIQRKVDQSLDLILLQYDIKHFIFSLNPGKAGLFEGNFF